ncbi:MAG: DUF2569 family protein [Candidatus Margulisbacteria bacterium]|nr:DUF2569 family protein [Candidatus Margulisiibacteriota bacterium]
MIIPADSWMVTFILPNEPIFDVDTIKELTRTVLAAIVWIPYLLISKRAKHTFVEKQPD